MTLKEKLEVEIMDLPIMSEVVEDIAKNLEYVADDFAICFSEWIFTNGREVIKKANEDGLKSTKELLEIYKKEKGL